jgi:transketolase
MQQVLESSVNAKALDLTRLTVEMTSAAGSGHPTSAASIAHIVAVLLYVHMRYSPERPDDPAADRLVLSEGHACPIVYAAGVDLGFPVRDGDEMRPMARNDAMRLRSIESPIDGHPNPAEGFPFFPVATGSLGQGLSNAAGLALAAELDLSDRRVFCIVGDAESREGQVWESLDFIVDRGLRRVCPIFNCNNYGQTGVVSPQQSPKVLRRRLEAAGFLVKEVDGHDPLAILDALSEHTASVQRRERPVAIIARTVKGWGISPALGRNMHGKTITGPARHRALDELSEQVRTLRARGQTRRMSVPQPERPALSNSRAETPPENLEVAIEWLKMSDLAKAARLSTREAFGVALRALGRTNERVTALDADVSNSTYASYFAHDPETYRRFVECHIGEQNMVSCAVGLARGGKIPFACSFARFLARAYDQFEMAVLSRANLKIVGSHAGVSVAADGPSQMALSDVPFFRSFTRLRNREGEPFFYLLQPADGYAAYMLTLAMAEREGPVYMRTHRPDTPFVYEADTEFPLGGHKVLSRGHNLLLVSSGYMVHECIKALPLLRESGIQPTLVDLYSLPFDGNAIQDLARQNMGKVLTVEDNYGGGFGAAVSDTLTELAEPCELRQLFVRTLPKSGRNPDQVLSYLGLSAPDIARAGVELLANPRWG